jgi:RNA polymerase sigma factor (sigma-70 family)
MSSFPDLRRLVAAARRGDERAWQELVSGLTPMLRRIARGFRLQPHDVDDVVQLTWLQAYRYLGSVRDPQAVPAWLATTTRRNALRRRQSATVEVLTDKPVADDVAGGGAVWDAVVREHHAAAVREALGRLSPRQRQLLEALLGEDAGYVATAAGLGIPIGSIGPTRARCLARLRKDPDLVQALAA